MLNTAVLTGKAGIRWFGDVHGSPAIHDAVAEALAMNYAVGFIGDLTDQSPADNGAPNDSMAVIRLLIELDAKGLVVLSPGNHCFKLLRYMTKVREGEGGERKIKTAHGLSQTLEELNNAPDRENLIDRFIQIVGASRMWNRMGDYLFVHGGATAAMFDVDAPTAGEALSIKKGGFIHRAIFGKTTGEFVDGFPERTYDWVDRIPAGKTVVIGHDIRPEITEVINDDGGRLIHIDTGAGKGGKLSWLDLTAADMGVA